jgi:hypothetical protein
LSDGSGSVKRLRRCDALCYPPVMETSQRSTGRTVAAVALAVVAAICALAFVGSLGQSSDSGSMDVVPAILAVALGLWAASLWRGKK